MQSFTRQHLTANHIIAVPLASLCSPHQLCTLSACSVFMNDGVIRLVIPSWILQVACNAMVERSLPILSSGAVATYIVT